MAAPTTNVTFTTDYGSFVVSLYADAAPLSTANFLYYVENLTSGYNAAGSFFHRLVPNFVLQGGGYGVGNGNGAVIPTQAAVPSEVSASRPNVAGSIAYATVSNDPNSGTDQFFFNLVDNPGLNSGFTVFGQITSGFSVVQAIAALQVVNASSALGSPFGELPIDRVATPTNFNFARDVVDFRVAVNLGVADNVAFSPFAQASFSDTAASDTVRITYAAANGVLSGGGFTGTPGSYSFTGTPAQAQAALRAVVFTPTANAVAVGQSVATPLSLVITNGTGTLSDTTTFTVSALSVNDAPVLSGTGPVSTPAGVGVRAFGGVTVVDPDVGQPQTVTVSFAAGAGVLSGGGFTGANGAYTLIAASAADAQASLRAAVFTPTANVGGVTTLNLSVSDGMASAGASLNVSSTSTPSNAPSIVSGFSPVMAPNVFRGLPTGGDAQNPAHPLYAQYQAQRTLAAQLDAGQINQAQAELALAHLVDGTTSVAVASYAFFTGQTPSLAGLNYLVHSTDNPNDLNDPYYVKFTTENRYINFAANLGLLGAGQAKFSADYGALNLRDATAKAYLAVFGTAADAAKVSALLDTQVPNGLGGTYTRADYFAQYGGDGINGQGTKAAMVGFLLSNAVATGAGVYGAADIHYIQALEHGQVPTGATALIPAYTPEVNLVGTPAVLDPAVTG